MTMRPSSSTIVLVTGAKQGIGFEIAKKLATQQKGYHIIVSGRRKDAIDEAAEVLRKQGLSVEPLMLDQTSDESIAAAVRAVEASHGRLDVLINNAAVSVEGDATGDRATWSKVFDTNVFGVAAVTDAFLPLLEKAVSTKRVVFISSRLSTVGMRLSPDSPAHASNNWRVYSTSKAALNLLAVHYMVHYEKDSSWKINVDHPGHCATNLNSFTGRNSAESGAVNACRLATLGPEGETGTFSSKEGALPW